MFDPTNMFNIVPETTKEEALNPSASLFGQALSGIAHKVLDPLIRYNIVKEQEMKDFTEKIQNRTTAIPMEDRDAEKVGLTLKAVEDSSYQLNSEELREMFANLIASTLDSRVNNEVHPSFSSILKDFSPKDASLFKVLFKENSLPITTVRVKESSSGTGVNLKENIILLENQDISEPVALNNLIRFGLVEIFPGNTLSSQKYVERYNNFKQSQYYKLQESQLPMVTTEFNFDTIHTVEGKIEITSLGNVFGQIVTS